MQLTSCLLAAAHYKLFAFHSSSWRLHLTPCTCTFDPWSEIQSHVLISNYLGPKDRVISTSWRGGSQDNNLKPGQDNGLIRSKEACWNRPGRNSEEDRRQAIQGETKNAISSQTKRDRTIWRPNGDHFGKYLFDQANAWTNLNEFWSTWRISTWEWQPFVTDTKKDNFQVTFANTMKCPESGCQRVIQN